MPETKNNVQKYIRLSEDDEIIIFPRSMKYRVFNHMRPVSGGYCCIHSDHVTCFEGADQNLRKDPSDEIHATKQVFGYDTMIRRIAKVSNKKMLP